MSQCHTKGLFCFFKVNVTVKAQKMKVILSTICSELLILLLPNFGLMAHHHKLSCLVKRLHCCVVVKVTAKVQNFSELLSWPYLLNC